MAFLKSFLGLHLIFSFCSCMLGSFSYWKVLEFPKIYHHIFYFFSLATALLCVVLSCFIEFSFGAFCNSCILLILPFQKKGIAWHKNLGFLVFGIALITFSFQILR